MKVIKTNWINLVGVFATVYIHLLVISFFFSSASFEQAIFGAILSVFLYGFMFWIFFIVALVMLDLMLIVKNQTNLKLKLFIEWLVISIPFVYWFIRYDEWIFLVAVISFLITQQIREKRIIEI